MPDKLQGGTIFYIIAYTSKTGCPSWWVAPESPVDARLINPDQVGQCLFSQLVMLLELSHPLDGREGAFNLAGGSSATLRQETNLA